MTNMNCLRRFAEDGEIAAGIHHPAGCAETSQYFQRPIDRESLLQFLRGQPLHWPVESERFVLQAAQLDQMLALRRRSDFDRSPRAAIPWPAVLARR